MSITTIKERLAEIQAEIEGVKRAYANGPKTLPVADLPCFVNFTGPATDDWRSLGADYDQESRLYIMRLYVAPAQQGIDGQAEAACEPFFPLVRDLFASRPGLGTGSVDTQLAGVEAIYLGDQGVSILLYAGVEYVGLECRLQVTELVDRSYDDGE